MTIGMLQALGVHVWVPIFLEAIAGPMIERGRARGELDLGSGWA